MISLYGSEFLLLKDYVNEKNQDLVQEFSILVFLK